MRRTSGPPALVLTALLLVAGCGGGGGRGSVPSGNLTSLLAPGVAAEDGVAFSDFTFRTDGALPPTGDLDTPGAGVRARQFYSFDLSAVPAGSIVTSAVLRADAFVVVGTPFTSLGSVVVDHVAYGALDGNDFAARALTEDVGTLADDATLGPRSLDVTDAVAEDVALGRSRAQFRLRFAPRESDGDFAFDFVSFAEAEAATTGSGQPPVLALVVRLPR
jgi:hypothetical protein